LAIGGRWRWKTGHSPERRLPASNREIVALLFLAVGTVKTHHAGAQGRRFISSCCDVAEARAEPAETSAPRGGRQLVVERTRGQGGEEWC
jgi:hypothetical protein